MTLVIPVTDEDTDAQKRDCQLAHDPTAGSDGLHMRF